MNGGAPQVSPDGKFLFHAKDHRGVRPIYRSSLHGGEEAKVIDAVANTGCWTVAKGIYFIPSSGSDGYYSIQLYRLDSGDTTLIAKLDRPAATTWEETPSWGMSVSPDGRHLLYWQFEEIRRDRWLVENFR